MASIPVISSMDAAILALQANQAPSLHLLLGNACLGDLLRMKFIDALKANTSLESLDLQFECTTSISTDNFLGVEESCNLCSALSSIPSLTQLTLNLRGNYLGEEGARRVGDIFGRNTTITRLWISLADNGLNRKGLDVFRDHLLGNCTLCSLTLDISKNKKEALRDSEVQAYVTDIALIPTLDKCTIHIDSLQSNPRHIDASM
eukprot:CAMPEP_0174231702 /NCGR_PEP_ID=MMETSP0417-20130205/2166_1 /TAXON_ID=242541 /ORGANISM="Mayorella sp, Strain BSH-02190019" /LENGTH=203 /DNA_ID=CAMNT_0015309629 /DNA_START=553 /DNA_END=1162 /DNA_ORIENTATION=-